MLGHPDQVDHVLHENADGYHKSIEYELLRAVLGLNLRCYRWFARVRGLRFAVAVVPAHLLHHLCNGLSFALGCPGKLDDPRYLAALDGVLAACRAEAT